MLVIFIQIFLGQISHNMSHEFQLPSGYVKIAIEHGHL